MATAYGGWCGGDDYRARLDYSTSSTDTAVTISATTKLNSGSGGYASNWSSSWNTKIGSSTSSGSGNLSFGSNATTGTLSSKTLTVNRTHSAQSVSVSAYVNSYCGSSTASATVSITALASYTVSYYMNGGSGSIANQTKWYGETLTLSSTVPTRTNYRFKGWATSQANANAGTVTYASGANYTGNAALTLYAVWELTYVAPTITSFKVFRCNSDGTENGESTTHIKVECSWSLDQTGGANTSCSIKLGLPGTTYLSPASTNGTVGTQSNGYPITLTGTESSGKYVGTTWAVYAKSLAISARLTVTCTLTDAHSLTATRTATVPVVFKPFSMANQGLAASFFGVAQSAWNRILHVFGDIYQTKETPRHYTYFTSHNMQAGQEAAPSAWTELESYCAFDSAGTQSFYSQLAIEANTTNLYRSYVVRRLNASGTAMLSGFYVYLAEDGNAYIKFTGTNMTQNIKNELQVGECYPIVTGKNLAKGASIGTYTDVYKFRLFLIKLATGDNNWCLGYRFGGSMGRTTTTASEHYIRGVGGYNTGTATYLFTSVIKVGANGVLTHVVSAQHLQATSANTGTELTFQALYGIA